MQTTPHKGTGGRVCHNTNRPEKGGAEKRDSHRTTVHNIYILLRGIWIKQEWRWKRLFREKSESERLEREILFPQRIKKMSAVCSGCF